MGVEEEGVMRRRVESQSARRPQAAGAGGAAGGFGGERLYPDAGKRVAAASDGRWEKGEARGGGFDPELTAARIYSRRIGAGLRNLGNTCYLNSVLQCLTYTEPFVAYLQSGKHKLSCQTAGFCALCALQNHVRCALQSTGKILTPMQFVKNLRCISRSFRNSRQEDAHELMVNLLESMHKCCLPSGIPSQSPSAYENSLVHRIFGGRLRSQVRCASCSHCSSKFDPFLDLSLEIANAATLVEALQNFTEEELLDGGEKQYNCQRCKEKVVAKKRFTIDKTPDVLTIHLKRFSPFNPRHKIDKKVDFQPALNLKPFVSNSEGMDFRYSLYGVLVHAGWNTQSGHYYCFVRTSSGIWHNLDDNQVHQVREADVLRQKAYMLFYVRDRVRSSMICKDNGASNFIEKNIISEITYMSDAIRNGLMEQTLNVSSSINGNVKSRKQNSDSNHPCVLSNISKGQCSKNHSKTQVIEAEASQNNGMVSLQKTPCIPLDAPATLFMITSPAQPDVIIHDSSGDKIAYEKPLQELELGSDGAFTNSGKGTAATLPICNRADGLFRENGHASEPQTDSFGKQTLNVSHKEDITQIMKTKGTAVTDGIISSREDLTCCNEAKELTKPVKQHNELVTVENTDAIANTEEQITTSEVCQAKMKDLSVKDTDHIANAEELASVQNSELEVVHVNTKKQIWSEDSAQVTCCDVSAHVTSSEHSAQVLDKDLSRGNLHKKRDFKSKRAQFSAMHLLFGSKLFLAALKLRKKRKNKRTRRWSTVSMDGESIADDQETSTSENVFTKDTSYKSRRHKRSCASATSDNDDQVYIKEQHLPRDSSCAADLPMDKKDDKNVTLDSAELPSSMADQLDSRNFAHANDRVPRHFDLLTRGLREITVPRWAYIDMSNTNATEFQHMRTNNISYVLDLWGEEHDHGRRKKVRKSKEEFSGPNHSQETTDMRLRQRKRLKSD